MLEKEGDEDLKEEKEIIGAVEQEGKEELNKKRKR